MKKLATKISVVIVVYLLLVGGLVFPSSFSTSSNIYYLSLSDSQQVIIYQLKNNNIEVQLEQAGGLVYLGVLDLDSNAWIESFSIGGEGRSQWIAWIEFNGQEYSLWVGKLEKLKVKNRQKVRMRSSGFIHSPALAVEKTGPSLWLSWIESNKDTDVLFVRELFSGLEWEVYRSKLFSVFTPKILIDKDLFVWLFGCLILRD